MFGLEGMIQENLWMGGVMHLHGQGLNLDWWGESYGEQLGVYAHCVQIPGSYH